MTLLSLYHVVYDVLESIWSDGLTNFDGKSCGDGDQSGDGVVKNTKQQQHDDDEDPTQINTPSENTWVRSGRFPKGLRKCVLFSIRDRLLVTGSSCVITSQ